MRLVYLRGDPALIARRQAARRGHFMPASLVASQFAALEEPDADERPILAAVEQRPREIVDAVVAQLPGAT